MSDEIPFEEAAAILGATPAPEPLRIPSPKIIGFTPEQLRIPKPIETGQYFLIKRTSQKAEFKRAVIIQHRQYADLFATLTIQRNALDERMQLIHRTVDDLRARGIPITQEELKAARARLQQYHQAAQEVIRRLSFVDQHMRQLSAFMSKVTSRRRDFQ
jgi:hypothetical protein